MQSIYNQQMFKPASPGKSGVAPPVATKPAKSKSGS